MAGVFERSPTFLKKSFHEAPSMSVETAKAPNSLQSTLQHLTKKQRLTSSGSTDEIMPVTRLSSNGGSSGGKENGGGWEGSLHSYHMWLKEKQKEEQEKKTTSPTGTNTNKHLKATTPNSSIKDEDEDDEQQGDENYQVDAIMERGPSPPENENSNSYEWSYEEQFKQLYEIDNDPDRKVFLDEYFEFMKGRGTPVSRIPIMAKQILDLFQLYHLVVKHGGLVQVIRNKLWSKITKGLNLPTSITSAAFTLRTQYLKYLYPYECSMHNFSTPKELQAAIDSNRRDRFSTLYHTEPTMTSSREDRFGYPHHGGCDYPMSQPRHHMGHMGLTPPPGDMRYGMKRPGEPIYSKYSKYGSSLDSPKVIVLQDGTPSMADHHMGKGSPPPSYYGRSRSPPMSRGDADLRGKPDMDPVRMRSHHFSSSGYGGKEWESEASRHVVEEERRRLMEDRARSSAPPVCKDKNCNGIDCKYTRPELQRHRSHDPMGMCSCSYCKDYRSYSPTSARHPELPTKHHMDGASASSSTTSRINGSVHSPPPSHSTKLPPRASSNGAAASPPPSLSRPSQEEDTSKPSKLNGQHLTTFKMKLPDLRQGGNKIQISLEVGGVTYEGVICANTLPATPISNGNSDITPTSDDDDEMTIENNGH
eukprot:TCONS_00031985-protein